MRRARRRRVAVDVEPVPDAGRRRRTARLRTRCTPRRLKWNGSRMRPQLDVATGASSAGSRSSSQCGPSAVAQRRDERVVGLQRALDGRCEAEPRHERDRRARPSPATSRSAPNATKPTTAAICHSRWIGASSVVDHAAKNPTHHQDRRPVRRAERDERPERTPERPRRGTPTRRSRRQCRAVPVPDGCDPGTSVRLVGITTPPGLRSGGVGGGTMQRLTGLDAAFLAVGDADRAHARAGRRDRRSRPTAPPADRSTSGCAALLEARLHLVQPFRRRLVEVPFGLHVPVVDRGSRLRPRLPPAPRRAARAGRARTSSRRSSPTSPAGRSTAGTRSGRRTSSKASSTGIRPSSRRCTTR